MSINAHVQTPYAGDFTLESLGLETKDHLNENGVLGYQTPTAPSAVIEVDAATPGPHDTSMNDSEVAKLPDWNTKINLIKENSNKIVDMKDVQKDIEGVGTMSDVKADVINATFENFYNDSNKKHHFTPFDSKTKYSYAVDFMNRRIRETTEALITEFRQTHEDSVGHVSKALADTREYCSEDLRDIINDAINKIEAIRPQLKEGAIVLPFNGDKFIDMTVANFMEVDIDQLKQGVPVSEEFKLAFSDMKQIWSDSICVRDSICSMAHAGRHDNDESPCCSEKLFMKTISHAFRADTGGYVYNNAITAIDETSNRLQERAVTMIEPIEQTMESYDLISSQAKELLSEMDKAVILKKDMEDIGKFAKAATCVLLGLVSLR